MKKLKVLSAVAAVTATAAALGAAASAYTGYIGLQTTTFSFRNDWTEANYGKATPYFDSWIVWGNPDTDPETYPQYEDNYDYDIGGYVLDATYDDATIEADGTYTVTASGIDWSLKDESDFNLVFVSTDIPADLGITVTDVSIIVDGETVKTVDEVTYDETVQYVVISLANIWNADIGSYGLAFPTDSMAIQFTINGLGGAAAEDAAEETAAETEAAVEETAAETEAAVEETAAQTEAPAVTEAAAGNVAAATTSSKGSPNTGIEDVAVIAGLAVLAGAGIALTRKRK